MIDTAPASGFLSVGQATARAIALRSAASGRLQRTLLVHGPAGAGKDAFVDDLLALAFCTDPDPGRRPCNACAACRTARARSHPDLVVGSPERWREGRSGGESIVAAARRWLGESAGAPIAGELRVLLIDGVDRAGEPIQNALLKALEEPTGRHMYILVADDASALLSTIRSRSQPLRIGAVPHAELVAWLLDNHRLPQDQAEALARVSGGMAGTAVAYVGNSALLEWRRRTQSELLVMLDRGRADRFGSVRELLDWASRFRAEASAELAADGVEASAEEAIRPATSVQREAAMLVADAWLDLARDLLLIGAGKGDLTPAAHLLGGQERVAEAIDPRTLRAFVTVLRRVRDGLAQNASPRLALEVAMLAWPRVPASSRR